MGFAGKMCKKWLGKGHACCDQTVFTDFLPDK
jgi:hypothetical protein